MKKGKIVINKNVRIPELYLKKIENIIGENVEPSDEHKFLNFQDVDELTKLRVRDIYNKANELVADRYLKYLMSKHLHAHTFVFLIEVIVDQMDLNEWIAKELTDSD